jgi:hypothetical protein
VQVASHAQKYFLRDSAANQIRKRQRPSIHDIRSSSSVPSTQLEQEQLKCSLQRINKQSMELEMNAASDLHGESSHHHLRVTRITYPNISQCEFT